MDLLSIILISIGLAMDAFAVSISKGLAMRSPRTKDMMVIGLWFGGFQFLMPVIGYYLGSSFHGYIEAYDHWVAFIMLLMIGLNMIRESLSEEANQNSSTEYRVMFLLAIATSIDALAVGISLAMDGADILESSVVIGMITFGLSIVGVKLGSIVGDKFSGKAEMIGGVILILIGLKILLEHLGFF